MQNRKKQYLLAAIGLVIMVALLVGSSYAALFNYENVSVGDMNIQTDDKFEVEGEQEVTIQNLVPTTYEEMEDNKITMTFVIFLRLAMLLLIFLSVNKSKADVESSRINNDGFLTNALPIQSLCL